MFKKPGSEIFASRFFLSSMKKKLTGITCSLHQEQELHHFIVWQVPMLI